METELLNDVKNLIENNNLGFEFIEARDHEVKDDGNIEVFKVLVKHRATGDEKEIIITFDFEKSTADIQGLIDL